MTIRTEARCPIHPETSSSRALWGLRALRVLAIALLVVPTLAPSCNGGPGGPPVSVTTVRPTNADDQVIYERAAARSLDDDPSTRLNMDVGFQNDGNVFLHLDEVRVVYPAGTASTVAVSGDTDLLRYDLSYDTPGKRMSLLWGDAWGRADEGYHPNAYQLDPFEDGSQSARFTDVDTTGDGNYMAGHVDDGAAGGWYVARYDHRGKLLAESKELSLRANAVRVAKGERLLVAGGYTVGWQDGPAERFRVARYHRTTLEPDGPFGSFGGLQLGVTYIQFPGCEQAEATHLDVLDTDEGQYYAVVGDLRCNGLRRIGIALLDEGGYLDPRFDGDGRMVLSGRDGVETGAAGVRFIDPGRDRGDDIGGYTGSPPPPSSVFMAIGAQVGSGCVTAANDCHFGVAAVELDGSMRGAFGGDGWIQHGFFAANEVRAHNLDVDSLNRIVLVGGVIRNTGTSIGMARYFSTNGTVDGSFGIAGLREHLYRGESSEAYDVEILRGDHVAITGWGYDTSSQPLEIELITIAFDVHGTFEWERGRERGQVAFGNGIVQDHVGRILSVGADHQDEVGHFASVRFLTNAAPDNLAWMAPGVTRGLKVPEDRDLPSPAPASVRVELDFDGYTKDLIVFHTLANHVNPTAEGGYRFPSPLSGLANDEFWATGQHHWLGSAHRGSSTQMHAYDMHVKRWTGSGWSSNHPGTDGTQNDDRLVWGKPIHAMADGEIVVCYATAEDHSAPGESDGDSPSGGGNSFVIEHTLDGQVERVLYAHLQEGSVPPALCPADGEQNPPIPVTMGTQLGLVGNSGSSSGPHLHIHAIEDDEARPLVFHTAQAVDRDLFSPEEFNFTLLLNQALVRPMIVQPLW